LFSGEFLKSYEKVYTSCEILGYHVTLPLKAKTEKDKFSRQCFLLFLAARLGSSRNHFTCSTGNKVLLAKCSSTCRFTGNTIFILIYICSFSMSIIYYFKKPSQQQKPFVACSRDTCNFQQGLLHELSIEQKRQQVKIIPSN